MTSRFSATLNADGTEYTLTWRSTRFPPYLIRIRWMDPVPGGHFPVAFDYQPAARARSLPPSVGTATAAGDALVAQRAGNPVIRIVAAPNVKITRDASDPEANAAAQQAMQDMALAEGVYVDALTPPPPSEVLHVRVVRVQSAELVPPAGADLAGLVTRGQYRSAPRGFAFAEPWPGEMFEPGLPAIDAAQAIEVYPQPNGVIFHHGHDDRTVIVTVPLDSTTPHRPGTGEHWRQRFSYRLDEGGPTRLEISCTPGVDVLVVDNRDPGRMLRELPGEHGFTVSVHETSFERPDLPVRRRDNLHELRGHDPQQAREMVHLIFSVVPFTGDVVDVGDFVSVLMTDLDLAGNPVSGWEFALLGVCAVLVFV